MLKSAGFTIQPYNFTPSEVVNSNISFVTGASASITFFTSELSISVFRTFPDAEHRVVTGGVSKLEYTFTKYFIPELNEAEFSPFCVESFFTFPLASTENTALYCGPSSRAA